MKLETLSDSKTECCSRFYSQRKVDKETHQERLMQIRSRYTSALQSNIMQFANFEKQPQAEKANAIVGLGTQMFKTMGQQSKTAFKAYKAFAITQALINTYQSETRAFAALAPIPFVGPALGATAAALAQWLNITTQVAKVELVAEVSALALRMRSLFRCCQR